MDYITNHWQDIVLIVLAAHVLARRIVDLTPTPKDNAVLASIDSVLRVIGIKVE